MAALKLVPLLFAGCFSEPARPHGLGAPIAANTVIRHKALVGDLNNDGYDDLVLFGDEGGPNANATLFVYFGGESLENPDVRIRVFDEEDAGSSYDILDASISISADGTSRGIVASLRAQNPNEQIVSPYFIPFTGRIPGTATTGHKIGAVLPSDAPESGGQSSVFRDTKASLPAHEVILGGNVIYHEGAPLDPSLPAQTISFAVPPQEELRELILLPPTGDYEDILFIGTSLACRTTGDLDANLVYQVGQCADIEQDMKRVARGRLAADGHFYAATTRSVEFPVPILDLPPTGDPIYYALTPTSPPSDVAIADVGGGAQIDLVVMQNSTLGVYQDLALADGTATPSTTVGLRDVLDTYDTLAIGNFHGDAKLEVYVLSDTVANSPLRCFHLDAAIDPCEEE